MPVTGPFENRRFRIICDGAVIPGISTVSSLQWTADFVTYREGGETDIGIDIPGKIKYQPLTLEREVTFDPFFENWARLVVNHGSQHSSIFKNLKIDILDPANQLVVSYDVYRSWPVTYEAFPALDAEGHLMMKERLILIYHGFERDLSVISPA
jgi:phage tail-like protein